jgi:hypothetical protein
MNLLDWERKCGNCGRRSGDHFWPQLGGRCSTDKDGPKFEEVALNGLDESVAGFTPGWYIERGD